MSTRKNLTNRVELRRKKALERRTADIAKYLHSGDKDKADKAKSDVLGLKKALGQTEV